MSASALQCYFPRLWDGGEKHINKRISVIVLAFGGKWSILSAAVIRFCGSRKDFPSHSCISSGLTESLAFRTSFLFWFGNQSLIFTLLFYIPWTRVCWSKPDFLKEEKRRAPLLFPSASEMIQNLLMNLSLLPPCPRFGRKGGLPSMWRLKKSWFITIDWILTCCVPPLTPVLASVRTRVNATKQTSPERIGCPLW